MTKDTKAERRWLDAAIAASAEPLPSFPWMRSPRKRPFAQKPDRAASLDLPVRYREVSLFARKGALAAR